MDFKRSDTSFPILLHGEPGRYWIRLGISSDIVRFVGIEVKMFLCVNELLPRYRYLRRVTLDTFLGHREELLGDSDKEEELFDECVDQTTVSCIC